MHSVVRPFVTASVALVGATAIAISPVAPQPDVHVSLPRVSFAAVQPAAAVNPIDIFLPAVQEGLLIVSNTLPAVQTVLVNTLPAVQRLFTSLLPAVQAGIDTISNTLPAVQRLVAGILPAVQVVIDRISNTLPAVQNLLLPAVQAGIVVVTGLLPAVQRIITGLFPPDPCRTVCTNNSLAAGPSTASTLAVTNPTLSPVSNTVKLNIDSLLPATGLAKTDKVLSLQSKPLNLKGKGKKSNSLGQNPTKTHKHLTNAGKPVSHSKMH